MHKPILIGALLLASALARGAERPVVYPAAPPPAEPQTASRAWLAIQASGQAASPVRQGATAAERERAYQRYLKSYEHEIPEYLLEDRGFGESKN
ncbi:MULTISPECIES: DUF3613 domain-containing protein [Pseudomonas aeruginosa group]|uniref:Uncharacterized protein n=3 Tax=Pseudomonas aeruginosa group TaxID=136841 RepID=A0A2R3IZP0_9PSED|nr:MULTISPECIES: DUF3613 domain-containing protein [Pseudomonas aeruginosa group]VTS65715.1 Protein of uncharacterised function (DUF3613) [Streptococcus dysgalactiae subsp. equisimilis]ABR83316.1 hypothetical protein PSPA7_4865 [Pseudomonas aeruginosa PA7]AVK07117.1 hypothetical protein CSB93_6225 [Pseudomonas paraeruginosa]AVR69469.1 DUF3613 domain-containing protein [Pseudomonas paraeruginosa]AWE92867.1 hypothetical protein CSC28_5027 [Pseudomonas paraeruginosa]